MENRKMKNSELIIYGLLLTAIVFMLSTLSARMFQLNIGFISYSFVTHSVMLILSIALIYGFRKFVNYKISIPRFKKTLKPILFGFLAAVVINPLMVVLTKILGGEVESHFAFDIMSPLQFFIFIFICASVAEEVLFRGFLQNLLNPLQDKGIKIFKRHISLPIFIGAIAFSIVHLILITSGAGAFFILRTLVFTFVLGIIAGYYQEKYNNNVYAIIVHMAGNLMGVIATLL